MRRRDFISALLLTPIAGSAVAQHPTGTKRIAAAAPAGSVADMTNDPYVVIQRQELERLGFVEGQNLIVERYSAEGKADRYADLAREVVSTQPDMIYVVGYPLTLAFKAATTTIPIVAFTGDPIRFGLVSNIAHPGGNITGVSTDAGIEIFGKRVDLLAQAVPNLRTALYFATVAAPFEQSPVAKATLAAAQKLGISLISASAGPPVDEQSIRHTFETIKPAEVDGIIFPPAVELYPYRLLIVELVRQVGIPAIYVLREQVEAGGLMAYSDDFKNSVRLTAKQIAEVLRGRKPAEMPYLQATKYEILINLKTAKALNLEIPAVLLARADSVIE